MKWTRFFIERPVTATVINVIMMLCGALAFFGLNVDEYPVVIVPKLDVSTSYPNASASTIEKEITEPLEGALSMVEGLESMRSESSRGECKIHLKFSSSVSMDKAVNQVNEQLARIKGLLPTDSEAPRVLRGGQDGGDAVIYLTVTSKTMSGASLTHFTDTHIKNHFQGIEGAAGVQVWGARYAVDITLDPIALFELRVSPAAIVNVLKKNELLLQAGALRTNEPINLDVVAKKAEDYENLVIGINGDAPVSLGDLATVYLSEDYRDFRFSVNGKNVVMIAISKASDGNILKISDAVSAMIPKVNAELRGEAEVSVELDKSRFVRQSLNTIYRTILEACILVILIIFLFLRHIRATLVPLVTIPISLVSTFFALKIFGLSINTITLLAMVLAVGLVVDDAIVVLENIFRYREEGLNAREAALKGASEIGFAIIAMTLTLVSVFLPLAFVSDITGAILREFAITLAAAVFFSGIAALTLSPMMCAHLLKNPPKETKPSLLIEKAITASDKGYYWLLNKLIAHRRILYAGLAVLLCSGVFLYTKINSSLLPKEDRGLIGAFIPMIPGFDLDRLEPYREQVEEIFMNQPEIERTMIFSFSRGIQIVSMLKPWNERSVHAEVVVDRIRQLITAIPSADVYPWSWNIGLSALEDDAHNNASIAVALKSTKSYKELEAIANKLAESLRKGDVLKEVRSDLDMNQKAFSIEIEREPAAALGIDEKAISLALQIFSDRMRPSEFKLEGMRYPVYLQSNIMSDDLSSIYISAKDGTQVPLSTVAKVKKNVEASSLKHLDQMRTATVLANLGEKMSLGEAQKYLDKVIKEVVPPDVSVSFEGALAMQEKSSKTFFMLFLAGLIFIFAIMAIQFEGIIDPLIILVTVPLALIGAVFLLWITKTDTNLYTQVGMLTLIGLITKHGILLTEFVSHHRASGMAIKEAIFMAAKWRFRPIVMTTLATVFGALPLIISSGAGVEARASIGLVIVGGMIFGTLLTLFVLPALILTIYNFKEKIWSNNEI